MSDLRYYSYPGVGDWARDTMGFSQAVRVGDKIEISGQGGWDPNAEGMVFSKDVTEQIAQAFANVDLALRNAGGKGWSQVYRVRSYHTILTPETTSAMTENLGKWMPTHKPIMTLIGVKKLGSPDMVVEIEVVALDPAGV